MKNLICKGDTITYANTGSAIAAGAVVVIGALVGVAAVAIAATTGTGVVVLEGVFEVPKAAAGSAKAWTPGQKLNYDVSAVCFALATDIAATGDITGSCVAFAAATTTATTGYVKFTGIPGTVTA